MSLPTAQAQWPALNEWHNRKPIDRKPKRPTDQPLDRDRILLGGGLLPDSIA
jgi:hypothetical protein